MLHLSIRVLAAISAVLLCLAAYTYVTWRSEVAHAQGAHLAKHAVLADDSSETSRTIFFTLGDHGTGTDAQHFISKSLESVLAQRKDVQFGLSLGDNFYKSGVSSVDDPLWYSVFEEAYSGPYLSGLPFYAVLGNHDVRGSAAAQVQYAQQHLGTNRWRMPARQYTAHFGQVEPCEPGCSLVQLVVLDTTQEDASLARQAAFLKASFEGSQARWRIVAGHHPVRSYGKYADLEMTKKALLPAMIAADIDLYLSGHDHNVQLIQRPGEPIYLIGGNGGQKIYGVDGSGPGLVHKSEEFGFNVIDVDEGRILVSVYTDHPASVRQFEIMKSNEPGNVRVSAVQSPKT